MYKRIIGVVLIDNGVVCRTRNFNQDYHYIDAHIDTNFFDEICFIDVTRNKTHKTSEVFLMAIERLMRDSKLPISIGGSIHSIEDIRRYQTFGVDRYVINQTIRESDNLAINCINEFGRSTIISSINHWGKFLFSNQRKSDITLADRLEEIGEKCGSEILINSVERDGTLTGMDIDLVRDLAKKETPSLIISGGLGRYEHALEMLELESVSAVCTSNIYHLTTKTISTWRKKMRAVGGNVRSV